MQRRHILGLLASIGICELAGGIGSIFTMPSIPTWYAELIHPQLAPPNGVFAPVWTALFVLMGIAAFLVWKQGTERREVKIALGAFGLQLILNTLWSVFFFGLHSLLGALIEISALWLAIFLTIILFGRISRAAALLLVPYIAWVSFAAYLTYSFLMLN